jgi:hypothetical protein
LLCFNEFKALLYNYLIVSGGFTVSIKVGTTSGGDELLSSTTLGGSLVGDEGALYGSGAGLGSAMPFHVPASSMPNAGTPQTLIYVTATISSGNLGNGSTSNITRGIVHLMPEYKREPLYLA